MKAGSVKIVEVGPRDGLQNEKMIIPLAIKVELINRLSKTGLKAIEAGSFVSPGWVPQMADSGDVLSQIDRHEGTSYSALVPNLQGYNAARRAKADKIAVFIAASETFSQKNINCTIDESLERIKPVLAAAQKDNIPVRGYISCITHCPYEGLIKPAMVAGLAQKLLGIGCCEISLGDTIGKATAADISQVLATVINDVPASRLAGHFHDTTSNALANVAQALNHGVTTFDASIAGLGGCPYAPGAPGNLDTEKLVLFLESKGLETGIDPAALAQTSTFVNDAIHAESIHS